jgi:hypothetical protein
MTKDKFRALCEDVLVPRLSNVLYFELKEVEEHLALMAQELHRLRKGLEDIAASLETGKHEGDR